MQAGATTDWAFGRQFRATEFGLHFVKPVCLTVPRGGLKSRAFENEDQGSVEEAETPLGYWEMGVSVRLANSAHFPPEPFCVINHCHDPVFADHFMAVRKGPSGYSKRNWIASPSRVP
jgi:hypothetical protein